jgi:hypothetical protein
MKWAGNPDALHVAKRVRRLLIVSDIKKLVVGSALKRRGWKLLPRELFQKQCGCSPELRLSQSALTKVLQSLGRLNA